MVIDSTDRKESPVICTFCQSRNHSEERHLALFPKARRRPVITPPAPRTTFQWKKRLEEMNGR